MAFPGFKFQKISGGACPDPPSIASISAMIPSDLRLDPPLLNESETEEEMDPWIPLIEEAKQRRNMALQETKESLINTGLDEQSAKDKAFSNMLPKLQKELENIYMERLVWMRQLKKDPVRKKIMHTKDALVENDDFDPEKALEAAVDKRKFLIRRLLKRYDFDEENDDDMQ